MSHRSAVFGGNVVASTAVVPEHEFCGIKIFLTLIIVKQFPFPLILGVDMYLHKMQLATPTQESLTL